ncbi:2'-5'-oligoadenylate synthase 1 isoform X14 [Symphalangus syndactylus]|uniref:2'-5'-oligoadenylate synthase 1 isoform X14 n=1 Tax=Symphalangus syndactylus TaxID=9590 RepID=UPI00244297F9|nr:2'-5'-oligoadenylate synthase 1 isoform X13 [Symphalangus syndactylus]
MMDLRNTPAKSLDKFIEDYLLPDTHFRMQINHAINIICGFLKERCFRGSCYPVHVSKVVKCKKKLGKLPPQYALELLTVYAWERGSMETHFNTARGFRTVLELVINYQQLCIYWTKYYDFKNPIIEKYLSRQLRKPRPVILDPADPTGNLGGGDPKGWRQLAQEAKAWLNYPCFKNWDGSPVSSWILQMRQRLREVRSLAQGHQLTSGGNGIQTQWTLKPVLMSLC